MFLIYSPPKGCGRSANRSSRPIAAVRSSRPMVIVANPVRLLFAGAPACFSVAAIPCSRTGAQPFFKKDRRNGSRAKAKFPAIAASRLESFTLKASPEITYKTVKSKAKARSSVRRPLHKSSDRMLVLSCFVRFSRDGYCYYLRTPKILARSCCSSMLVLLDRNR